MHKKKIVLVYTGYEQGTWGEIAFRKEQFYHYLPGILYLASVLKSSPLTATDYEVVTRHYNSTVQDLDDIVSDLTALSPDCIGFSCYCWNLPFHKKVAALVKQQLPKIRIMLGGPEITKKNDDECRAFFTDFPEADLIVFGESEEKIAVLADALCTGAFTGLSAVSGYCFNPHWGKYVKIETNAVSHLSELPRVYPGAIEVKRSVGCGIFVVYECSRGCPNNCIYCQFIRLRKKQEFFPFERVESELQWLLEQEVDGIHFADAVFDKDPLVTTRILNHIHAHNRRSTILCYCSFATLDNNLAALYEKVQCQIGVGVQSTNSDVLRVLKRAHFKRLFNEVADILAAHGVNFYVDLMFGLPHDSIETFRQSFEDALRLHPAFMMLFPLALIKGTPLGDNPEAYETIPYAAEDIKDLNLQCDIEYLNLGLSKNFSLKDLELFDDVTLTCFYYYNRFRFCMAYLQKRWNDRLFELYREIGRKTKDFIARTGQKPSNQDFPDIFKDEVKAIYKHILDMTGAGPREEKAFKELYKLDIFRMTVLASPQREKIFNTIASMPVLESMPPVIDPAARIIKSTFGKTIAIENPLDELMLLAEKQESITAAHHSIYIHAPFNRADTIILRLSPEIRFIIDFLTIDHGQRFKSLLAAFRQNFRRTGENELVSAEYLSLLLKELHGKEIIRFLK